ncbi:hypothetical protein SEA_DUSTYDINO_16 [Microbacterium phage DustyDino]|nr:hypothetical protein SEA_DUSTYDINO_16 [Microbacterium phage DustyDino]
MMATVKDLSQPNKHVNGLGEVMWQPAITGWGELRYGPHGDIWTDDRRYGKPVLYTTYWWARRRGRKKAAAKARSTWERVE